MGEVVVASFEMKWLTSDGDCSPCYVCKEPIYGKKVTLVIATATKQQETKVRLCESCYGLSKTD
jgi:hypothetical protein